MSFLICARDCVGLLQVSFAVVDVEDAVVSTQQLEQPSPAACRTGSSEAHSSRRNCSQRVCLPCLSRDLLLQELADSFSITQLPTAVLVKQGAEVHRITSRWRGSGRSRGSQAHQHEECACLHGTWPPFLLHLPSTLLRPWCCYASISLCAGFTHKRPARAVSQAIRQFLLA